MELVNLVAHVLADTPSNSTNNGTTPTNSTAPVAVPHADSHGKAFGSDPLGSPLSLFLVQVIIIVSLCRGLAFLLGKIRQPSVIAEVIAGILLGPSALSRIPEFKATIFPATSLPILNMFAQIGLIFFMFLIGLELDFGLLKRQLKHTLIISVSGIVLPFGFSALVSWAIWSILPTSSSSFGAFLLFMGVAMSITAFPVLARIIKENGMFDTKMGLITLSTAAWDDVAAWCLLALSISVTTGSNWLNALWSTLLLIAFVLVMMLGTKRALEWFFTKKVNRVSTNNGETSNTITKTSAVDVTPLSFCALLLLLVASAWITEYIGIHAIFGAFILGLTVPRVGNLVVQIAEKIEDLIIVFLLPLYFTFSGLRTEIGLLDDGTAWGLVFLIIAAAVAGKVLGGTFAAKFTGMGWRESFSLGILMNTKGLVELIVLNIGLDYKIISPKIFTMMVVMALVTTFMTSPIISFLYPLNRILEFEAEAKGRMSLLLAIRDRETLPGMLKLLDTVTKGKPKKWKVVGMRIIGVQERPSAYMKHLHDDEVLTQASEMCNLINIKLKAIPIAGDSADPSLQITHVASAKGADFIFTSWDVTQEQLETAEHLGGSVVRSLEKRGLHNLGTLIDRGLARQLTRVTYVYSGTRHDMVALKLIRSILEQKSLEISIIRVIPFKPEEAHKGGELKIPSDPAFSKLLKTKKGRKFLQVDYVHKQNPARKVVKLLKKHESELLIIGSEDKNFNETNEVGLWVQKVVSQCTQSVLIVTRPIVSATPDEHVDIEQNAIQPPEKLSKRDKSKLKKQKSVPLNVSGDSNESNEKKDNSDEVELDTKKVDQKGVTEPVKRKKSKKSSATNNSTQSSPSETKQNKKSTPAIQPSEEEHSGDTPPSESIYPSTDES